MQSVGILNGTRRSLFNLRNWIPFASGINVVSARDFHVGNPKFIKGLLGSLSLSNREIKRVGICLCSKCTSNLDTLGWFKTYDLDDTFFSWFKVVELHVWMLSLRLLQDPSSEMNKILVDVRDSLIECTWFEVHNRMGAIGVKGRRRQYSLSELSDQLRVTFLIYDDGVLGSDTQLANALWEGFFNKREDIKLDQLARLVEYVRQNLLMLEKLENTNIAIKQDFSWVTTDSKDSSDK